MEKSGVVRVDGAVDAFAEPLVFRFSDEPLQSVSHDFMAVMSMFQKQGNGGQIVEPDLTLWGLDLIDR